jgi:hypothetical protein
MLKSVTILVLSAFVFGLATATPVLAAAGDWPAMVTNTITVKDGKTVTMNECRDSAVNTYAKVSASHLSVQENSIWAVMDFESHSYSVVIWCEPDRGLVMLTSAGPTANGANATLDAMMDAFLGKSDPPPRDNGLSDYPKPDTGPVTGPVRHSKRRVSQ